MSKKNDHEDENTTTTTNHNNDSSREFLLSICAYHRVFYQLVSYIMRDHKELMMASTKNHYNTTKQEEEFNNNSIPFVMEEDSIDGLNLGLSSSDREWSDIVYRMVSNMKWVSSLITSWSSYS
jgi:hypothetical protein